MTHTLTVVLAVVVIFCGTACAAAWKPAEGPLMTRWAKDVSPDNALVEYPRPQMVRPQWTNLNGLWQWAEAAAGDEPPVGKDLAGQILVPFPIESALSGVMRHADRLWYRRTFDRPKAEANERVLLHFGAVDWEATVFVNGKKVGEHRGCYDPFSCDITDALTASGKQELIVGVFDPTDKGTQPRGKQVLDPKGIWYTPVTGIWQTVWTETVPATHIAGLLMTPDVEGKCLRLTVSAAGADGLSVKATAQVAGADVGHVMGNAGEELRLPLADVKLWSPDSPLLYDLKVDLVRSGRTVDAVTSYFGMRSVSLGKDEKGIPRLLLNGKFVMQVGPLDQGWWPDGLYTAPTDEALKYDVEVTRQLGFNMTRKHVKVEPARWYYWCDKLGLLVWQDMPSGNSAKSDESKKQYEAELAAMIAAFRNHPSIIMWVVFNEGWGQYDTERLTAWTKQTDPSRLVNNASGWTDKNAGDVHDIHSYPNPKCPPIEETRAAVLGEFGGLGLAIPGHTWKKEHWGYQGMADAEQLTSRYEAILKTVWELKDDPGLCAAVYTQITDVEIECNGLLTYDRAVIKTDIERVAAVNRGDLSRVPVTKVLVPSSQAEAKVWRYTFTQPADDWMKPSFDASAWKEGPGGFGREKTPGAVIRTNWHEPDIWMRREFTMPDRPVAKPYLSLHHDEDAEVYINGVLAAKVGGFTTDYDTMNISPEAAATLKPGKNVIAVHCRQTGGGQYIDVGLVELVPPKK
jgi:hypothetical protein